MTTPLAGRGWGCVQGRPRTRGFRIPEGLTDTGNAMRQSTSLPSIRGRPELGSYPFLDHNLCNVSAVQERLRDAQLQRRREKLGRVEASRVERATQRIKWGGMKADSDARAARRTAALAQQVLETRSRISVQLAQMKSSLREEQAKLLAPIQDMADAHEEACLERRSVARERVVMAASKVAAICDAAATQVRQEFVARSRLRHSMIESDRMHAEAIAAAEGRGPRRERIQPKGRGRDTAAGGHPRQERATMQPTCPCSGAAADHGRGPAGRCDRRAGSCGGEGCDCGARVRARAGGRMGSGWGQAPT